jgi:hypothetical protein
MVHDLSFQIKINLCGLRKKIISYQFIKVYKTFYWQFEYNPGQRIHNTTT